MSPSASQYPANLGTYNLPLYLCSYIVMRTCLLMFNYPSSLNLYVQEAAMMEILET